MNNEELKKAIKRIEKLKSCYCDFESFFWLGSKGTRLETLISLLKPEYVNYKDPDNTVYIDYVELCFCIHSASAGRRSPTLKPYWTDYVRPFLLEYMKEGKLKELYKETIKQMEMANAENVVKEI